MTIFKAKIVRVITVVLGLALVYDGCAVRKPVEVETTFDESEHKPYMQLGGNGIIGQASFTRQNGGITSCAGGDVLIVPATSFFREMMRLVSAGYTPLILENIPPAYRSVVKPTPCDAQGNFSAGNLPSGAWFVWADVHRNVGYGGQGGDLIREVTLSNNETVQVLLTDKDMIGR